MASGEVIIFCENLSKIYHTGGETVYALRDMDLQIFRGEYLSVMGPSGSGKSTLFNMIGALDKPSAGTIRIGGVDLTAESSLRLSYFRNRHIGYVFQSFNLIPSLTALRNVMLPLVFAGLDNAEATEKATAVLGEVGLADRLEHRPSQLSGGQQQRVAVARALAMRPTIILADEPTANLDLDTGEEIIQLLKRLSVEQEITVITATHDHKMLAVSDRILWIKDGRQERLENREDLRISVGTIE